MSQSMQETKIREEKWNCENCRLIVYIYIYIKIQYLSTIVLIMYHVSICIFIHLFFLVLRGWP